MPCCFDLFCIIVSAGSNDDIMLFSVDYYWGLSDILNCGIIQTGGADSMSMEMQEQNEALIRLMLAARYQDRKLSLAEEDEFLDRLEKIRWESGIELDFFVMKETAVVRKALETDEGMLSFVADQCSRFNSIEEKKICLKTIESLMQSDGIDNRESAFLKLVENALYK